MNELVEIKRESALDVFKQEQGLEPYLKKIRAEIDSFAPCVESKKDRDEIASLAHKVARSKTYLDGIGKELVAELKEIPAKIDAERKRMRDTLDDWKAEVREPLTAWEAEQAAIKLKEEVNEAHEEALGLNDLFDREREIERKEAKQRAKEEAEIIERERQAAEEKLKQALAEKARIEAEEKVAREKAEAERKIAEQRLMIERAEQDAREAKERAEKEAQEKSEREKQALIAKEEEVRKSSEYKDHRARINNAILATFIDSGLSEEAGRDLIKKIVSGRIPNLRISY